MSEVSAFDPAAHVHRRWNPLAAEWVLVSPHRALRPWQGQVEDPVPELRPEYDPDCYLCPGNARAGGVKNQVYRDVFVFDNDFAALKPDTPAARIDDDGLIVAESERGICRVLCFSPRHDLTLPELEPDAVVRVVEAWTEQYAELGARPGIGHVQIFENKGAAMGCSNPHPQGQIWAQEKVPELPARELRQERSYYQARGRTLLAAYLERERVLGERIVAENDSFTALVPFWAVWPFELLLIVRRPVASLLELEEDERTQLAELLRQVTTRYDNLFRTSFPYSAGLHQAPTDGAAHPEYHLHLHFYPPLLRSATVRKFMVGYEMLGEPQRDITPERSAELLRQTAETHYRALPAAGGIGAGERGEIQGSQ